MIRFRTETGSLYELNRDDMSWARLEAAQDKDPFVPLRTESGQLLAWPDVKVGERCEMIGPPVNPAMTFRWISTSPVVEVLPT